MASDFREMTEKMQQLYLDIIASLGKLPTEIKEYIFGSDEDEDMDWIIAVANYITLEFIKYSYNHEDPQYSLRHFLKKMDADDSERMRQSRTVQYVLKYKRKEIEEKAIDVPSSHKYANINMDSVSKKREGYRFTEMNYFEHQNIYNLEIIKAIVEKRIGSSKKVSNQRFVEMFDQYDKMIESLAADSLKSNQDMVFSSLAVFTIEWHYAIEMLYYLACFMEEKNIKDIDQNTLILLCGSVYVESRFGSVVATDSRMVKERLFVLEYLFNDDTDSGLKIIMIDLIKEIISLGVHYKESVRTNDGELYKEWFRKESTISDWASFFRYYDIFGIWQKKVWTRKRIQNMRKLLNLIIRPKE